MVDPLLVIVLLAVIVIGAMTCWCCYAPDRAAVRAHRREEAERSRLNSSERDHRQINSSPKEIVFPVDRFSFANLMEVVAAYGIVFTVHQTIRLFDEPRDSPILLLALLYPLKNLLARLAPRHRLLSTLAYIAWCITVCLVSIYIARWSSNPLEYFAFFSLILLPVPTASFLLDLFMRTPTRIRILIWRSAVELLIVFPMWLFFVILLGLFLGVWSLG